MMAWDCLGLAIRALAALLAFRFLSSDQSV
jgi:hypothetical protein